MPGSTTAMAPHERGIRRGTRGFESEFAGYLQRRLRLLALWLFVLLLATYALDAASILLVGRPLDLLWTTARLAIGLDGIAVGAWWILARRPGLSTRMLSVLDVALFVHSAGLALFLFHGLYGGSDHLLHWLSAAIVARSVLVPSRAARTFWLGLAAIAAMVAVHVLHGARGDDLATLGGEARALAFTAGWWVSLAWRVVEQAAFLSLAVLASKMNFSLRLKAYEARELDQYVLEAPIGRGAMGEVHRARHSLMKRPVAIKFIRSELVGETVVQRFEKEVQATSRLTHPNTIAIYDYGQTPDGLFFYAMEHLEGADLERVVERTGPMPASRVVHVLAQACGALDEAHARGLVHRDVKPGNLFLCETGLGRQRDVVKVMDFGLVRDTEAKSASATRAGDVVGTPHTISPECIRGRPATAASDLYALGAVGCTLLTGRPIFDAATAGEFISAHLNEEPVRPSSRVASVPSDLEDVLLRCLAKSPQDRWASAADLRAALLACADAGRWTDADAEAWWTEHRARFSVATAGPSPETVDATARGA